MVNRHTSEEHSAFQNSRPKVSVIMNCLNAEKYLREAIDSVYIQTYQDWEIIFWDTASADHSGEIANSYDRKLRYFRSDEVVPLGHARNLALEEARGEYFAFLDCDDIWLPEKLEKQIPLFKDPNVGLTYTDALYFNHRGYERAKYGSHLPPQGKVFDAIMFNNFICMSTAMIRSDITKKYNVQFDPSFTAIEDTDLFMRISRNWEVAYASQILCKYRMHENNMSFSTPLLFREEEERLVKKCKKIFPEFAEVYETKCREQIVRDYAMVFWKQGKNSEARKKIKPLIFNKWTFFLTYLITFFPYRFARRVRQLTSKRAFLNY